MTAQPRLATGFGIGTAPPLWRVKAAARMARVTGFDSIWVVDHFMGFIPRALWDRDFAWIASPDQSPHALYDYQVLVGSLARMAGGMQIGVGVTEPIRRHPVLLAQAFMTLSHLTRRPPILGIGPGERENVEPYGLDFTRPVARLDEALQVIRMCFDAEGPFDYDGEFFTMRGAVMDLRSAKGRTPEIWVAAHGPRMLRLCGRHGDGWWPAIPMSPDDYASRLSVIRKAARSAGRDPDDITPGLQVAPVIAPTEAEARAILDLKAVRFFTLLLHEEVWQAAGLAHPLGEGFRGMVDFVPEQYTKAELEEVIWSIPADFMAGAVMWGTPDQVLTRLRALGTAGLRHVSMAPASAVAGRRMAVWSLRKTVQMARRLRKGT